MVEALQKSSTILFRTARSSSWGSLATCQEMLEDLAKKRMVVFGEKHGNKDVIELQTSIQQRLIQKPGNLAIIMEQFSFEMQHLLEDYQAKKITIEELDTAYQTIGTEGHDVIGMKPFLELARENAAKVKLFGGFIPRTYARQIMRESKEAGLASAVAQGYLKADEDLIGSDQHYNMFESMISGRDMHNTDTPPTD